MVKICVVYPGFIMKKSQKTQEAAVDSASKLLDDTACYVLITCGHPSSDGQMKVEMTYEGDKVLASYLLENALGQMDSNPEL